VSGNVRAKTKVKENKKARFETASFLDGGGTRIRTLEGIASRFTVRTWLMARRRECAGKH
jgi:hypothetical protein